MNTLCTIVAEKNIVATALAKALIKQGVEVNLATTEPNFFSKGLDENVLNQIKFVNPSQLNPNSNYIFNLTDKEFIDIPGTKTINIKSYHDAKKTDNTILLGDVYGPSMSFSNTFVDQTFLRAHNNEELLSPTKKAYVYPIYFEDAAEEILRIAFAFEKSSKIIGQKTLAKDFVNQIAYITNTTVKNDSSIKLNKNNHSAIPPQKITYNSARLTLDNLIVDKPQNKKKLSFKKPNLKPLIPLAYFAVALSFLPGILILTSLMTSLLGFRLLNYNNTKLATAIFHTSASSARLAQAALFLPADFINGPIGDYYELSLHSADFAQSGKRAIKIIKSTNKLAGQLTSQTSTEDTENLIANLNHDLDALYQDTAFLESDLKHILNLIPFTDFNATSLKKTRESILVADSLSKNLHSILGYKNGYTIAIATQNNSKITPSGGVVEKIYLVTLKNGKIDNISTYDSHYLSQNVQGIVEPPEQLKKYANMTNWPFEYADWSTSFPENAEKINWFLQKSINKSADAVIAVNKNAPLLQLGSISSSNQSFTLETAKKLLQALENKSLQVHFRNNSINKSTKVAGWSNQESYCGDNCTQSILGFNEANLAHTNAEPNREALISITIDPSSIKTTSTFKLSHPASSPYPYQVYLRNLASPGYSFTDTLVQTNKETKKTTPELTLRTNRVEAGQYLQVNPGSKTTTVFTKVSPNFADTKKEGSLEFLILKQPGVGGYNLNLRLNTSGLNNPKFYEESAFLTADTSLIYNTVLSKDKIIKIKWQQ